MPVSSVQMARVLHDSLNDESNEDEVVRLFLEFCEEKKLTHLLPNIVKHLEKINAKKVADNTIRVYVARDQDKDVVDMIVDFVSKKSDAPMSVHKDEKIIGGFVALYRNTVYDGSVTKQLARAKEILSV